jgi:DNA gyrase subunit A
VINIKVTERNGDVVSVRLARDGDDLLFITDSGMIVRTPADEMRPMGRNTAGVRLVNLKGEDRLVALEVITSDDLELEAKNLQLELSRDGGRQADALLDVGHDSAAEELDELDGDEEDPDALEGDVDADEEDED